MKKFLYLLLMLPLSTWADTLPFAGVTYRGDENVTLMPRTSTMYQFFDTTLTANRTVTLSTTLAIKGDTFVVVRSAATPGAFTLDVGGLQTVPVDTKATVTALFNGASWVLASYSLVTYSGAGATAWNDIGDATADGTIALAGFETDFTSTLDSAGEASWTITNTDADTAADTSFFDLRHNDGADANVFYARFIGDNDGTPSNDYLFSQTAMTIGTGIQSLFPDGTAANPSIGWASDNDGSGTGLYRSAANNIGVTINGTLQGSFGSSGGVVTLGIPGLDLSSVSDTRLTRESSGVLQVGVDAASPISQTFKGPDGSGSNIAGGGLAVKPGRGTGTGIGGAYQVQTSVTNASGSTLGSYVTRQYAYAGDKELTESSATTVFTVTLTAGKYASVKIFATTHADDNTDFTVTTDEFNVSLVAKSTAISSNISTVQSSTIGSAGSTLTTSWTVTDNGDNTYSLKNNAVASLTQVRLKTGYQIWINSDEVSTITP